MCPRTRLVALPHVSNMLGYVLDTDLVAEQAHKVSEGAGGQGGRSTE